MKIHRRVSKKNYLHGKAVYEYERFCVPVPKRFQDIVKPFVGGEVQIEIEPCKDGFTVEVHLSARRKSL